MQRKYLHTLLMLAVCSLSMQAQFVTILGKEETIQNDTTAQEYPETELPEMWEDDDVEETEDEGDEEDDLKKRFQFKKVWKKVGNWLGIRSKKDAEQKKDTVPTDPSLFSYDEVENEGQFIFTEAEEKAYLDSIKLELIKRRRQVLERKSMVSMPMERLLVTSYFGYRRDPFDKSQIKFHNGVDFAAQNYFVNAVLPGIVRFAGYRGGYGYCVELQHGEVTTLYAHLSYILVQKNQPVPAGEPIGISGTTGRSTGEHLHFSVISQGKFVDPIPLLEYLSDILQEARPVPLAAVEPKEEPLPVDTIPDEPVRKTKGTMLVPDGEPTGAVIRYGGGTDEDTRTADPRIRYSGRQSGQSTPDPRIRHHGEVTRDIEPTDSIQHIQPRWQRGTILPENHDSIRTVGRVAQRSLRASEYLRGCSRAESGGAYRRPTYSPLRQPGCSHHVRTRCCRVCHAISKQYV